MTKPELIKQLRIAIRRKHYAYATEKTYATWVGNSLTSRALAPRCRAMSGWGGGCATAAA